MRPDGLGSAGRSAWYLYHALAALSVALLIAGIAMNVFAISHRNELGFFFESNAARFSVIAPILAVYLVGSLWLWIAMLSHYFIHRPPRRAAAWGWFLIVCNWAAAIVYFVQIWRPANAHRG